MKTIGSWVRLVVFLSILMMQVGYAGDPQPIRTFDASGGISFTPDGKKVLIGGQLFSVDTGELLHVFGQGGWANQNAITSDGRIAATETVVDYFLSGVILWDLATREKIRTFLFPCSYYAWALSQDGRQLAIAGSEFPSRDRYMMLYDVNTGEMVRSIELLPLIEPYPHVHRLVFSPDGTTIAAKLHGDEGIHGAIVLFNCESGQSVWKVETDAQFGGAGFSPDGRLLAAVTCGNASCHVWDLATGQPLHESPGMGEGIVFSPDGRLLLVGGYGSESRIISLATGRELRNFPAATSVAWSPDGRYVLLGNTLWDVRNTFADPKIVKSTHGMEVQWNAGILQYAPTLDGPWGDLPSASPMPLSPVGERGFFRVKIEQ